MKNEQELITEMEKSYNDDNLFRVSEICDELYELKTGEVIAEPIKASLEKIIAQRYKGIKPYFGQIKNVLYGIIELNLASKN